MIPDLSLRTVYRDTGGGIRAPHLVEVLSGNGEVVGVLPITEWHVEAAVSCPAKLTLTTYRFSEATR